YALGCTLYYALTGRQPFSGGTSAEKIRRHRNEEPAPVPQFNPDVPPGFIGVLRRMMAKKPEHRFASAAALRDELLAWAAVEPGRRRSRRCRWTGRRMPATARRWPSWRPPSRPTARRRRR